MAIEATRPRSTILSGEILVNKGNLVDSNRNMNMYGTGGSITEALTPIFLSAVGDFFPLKESVKLESQRDMSYVGRKRSRDDPINNYPLLSHLVNHTPSFQNLQNNGTSSFQNQQLELLEMDYLISQHMQKITTEMEEKRRNHFRRIITVVEHSISKKLRVKEDEIQKLNKLNSFLEERVQSLTVENHIWREQAQSNEATANAFRSNLEQALALAQVQDDKHRHMGATATALIDDEQESCCDSSYPVGGNGGQGVKRWCLNCGKEEATCLFLPCRHLCVCYACGPLVEHCPLCNSAKNGCIQVIL